MHRRFSINLNTKIIQLDFWVFQINCLIIQAEGKEERDFIKKRYYLMLAIVDCRYLRVII
jgi:hypothetical protein